MRPRTARRPRAADPALRAAVYENQSRLAEVLRASDQPGLAIFFGKASITQIERERRELVGPAGRYEQGFLRDKVAVYRSVADRLMELGRIDEGLEVLKLMKSTELSDFAVREAVLGAADRDAELTQAEATLHDRYAQAVHADAGGGTELARLAPSSRCNPSVPLSVRALRHCSRARWRSSASAPHASRSF